jgi:hypothetical protein
LNLSRFAGVWARRRNPEREGPRSQNGSRRLVEAVGVEPTSENSDSRENYMRIPFMLWELPHNLRRLR